VIEERPMFSHGGIQRLLARMSERRMSDIVHQGEGFHEIDIQSQLERDSPRDLRNLYGVSQSITEMVGIASRKNLRLGFQTAKRSRMNYAISVTLKITAIGVRRLGITSSAGIAYRVVGEHVKSLAEEVPDESPG